MKTVKVYGPGCKRCETTELMVREAAAKLGIEVEIEKVSDPKSIAIAGVMSIHSLHLPQSSKSYLSTGLRWWRRSFLRNPYLRIWKRGGMPQSRSRSIFPDLKWSWGEMQRRHWPWKPFLTTWVAFPRKSSAFSIFGETAGSKKKTIQMAN